MKARKAGFFCFGGQETPLHPRRSPQGELMLHERKKKFPLELRQTP